MRRVVGFRALYIRYYYLLGGHPQWRLQGPRRPTNKQILFIFREDIRKMNQIGQEMKLLGRHRIDTAEQLSSFKDGLTNQIAEITDVRQRLRYKARNVTEEPTLAALKAEIADCSARLAELRKEVRLCNRITARTAEMTEKIRKAAEIRAKEQAQIKSRGKEQRAYDQFRGRR